MWGDYARGAKFALKKCFELAHGIDGVLQGSLLVGGLSSSAAVLIAYVMAFAKANSIKLQPFEVVQIASEAEREYIGLNNGLLYQSCIALGKKDLLLFLDCDTYEYRHISSEVRIISLLGRQERGFLKLVSSLVVSLAPLSTPTTIFVYMSARQQHGVCLPIKTRH